MYVLSSFRFARVRGGFDGLKKLVEVTLQGTQGVRRRQRRVSEDRRAVGEDGTEGQGTRDGYEGVTRRIGRGEAGAGLGRRLGIENSSHFVADDG